MVRFYVLGMFGHSRSRKVAIFYLFPLTSFIYIKRKYISPEMNKSKCIEINIISIAIHEHFLSYFQIFFI